MTVSSFCLICSETWKKNVFVIFTSGDARSTREHWANGWIKHAMQRTKNNNILLPESIAAFNNSTFILLQKVQNIEALWQSRNALQFCLIIIVQTWPTCNYYWAVTLSYDWSGLTYMS